MCQLCLIFCCEIAYSDSVYFLFGNLLTLTSELNFLLTLTGLTTCKHRWELPGNYPYFEKYGNLPLCLDNYALFSLPPIFTTILYTYPLRHILYLGEPSVNTISNYHGTFIHLYMHWYDPIYKIYKWNSCFSLIHMAVFFLIFLCQQYIKNYFIIYKLNFYFSWYQWSLRHVVTHKPIFSIISFIFK